MVGKDFYGEVDDVIEIQGVVFLELFLVLGKDPGERFFVIPVGLLGEKLSVDHVVFGAADGRQEGFRVELVGVYLQLLHDLFDHGLLILGVYDMESAFVSQSFYLGAKDAHADGMEGSDDRKRTSIRSFQDGGDPFLHLLGGFVGEGHGQNVTRADPSLLDEVGDAVGKCLGLSRARSGDDQHRTVYGRSGEGLFFIQTF